jgi:hypothetical protein
MFAPKCGDKALRFSISAISELKPCIRTQVQRTAASGRCWPAGTPRCAAIATSPLLRSPRARKNGCADKNDCAGDERQKAVLQLTLVAATQEAFVELRKRKMHELKEALVSQDCELISLDPVAMEGHVQELGSPGLLDSTAQPHDDKP